MEESIPLMSISRVKCREINPGFDASYRALNPSDVIPSLTSPTADDVLDSCRT